jgi:hypothetical protein
MPHFGIVMSTHLLVTCPLALPSLPIYLLLVCPLCDHARLLIACLLTLPLSPTYLLLVCLFHHHTHLLVTWSFACLLSSYLVCHCYLFAYYLHVCLIRTPSLPTCFAIIALLAYYMSTLFMFALNFKFGIPPLLVYAIVGA